MTGFLWRGSSQNPQSSPMIKTLPNGGRNMRPLFPAMGGHGRRRSADFLLRRGTGWSGMTDKPRRVLTVEGGSVQCLERKKEPLERCRFCVHSVRFYSKGSWRPSPARAYCISCRTTEEVALDTVAKVCCDDGGREGFHSIMNVIS